MVSQSEKAPQGAWRMVALGFVTQNLSIGFSIASFGVVVLAIEEHFHTTRTLASLGASLVVATLRLLAPLTSWMIERWSIRTTMMVGVVLGSVGYVALALAPNIWLFLSAYTLLVGIGSLLAGGFPASILVSNWFPVHNGRALGVMMIPHHSPRRQDGLAFMDCIHDQATEDRPWSDAELALPKAIARLRSGVPTLI